ncbi:MAG: hypothetical protein FWG83_02860 [Oscillospiraceae bacterium]|nr:hypothetical protein [Oscillospiraceae bacterium]
MGLRIADLRQILGNFKKVVELWWSWSKIDSAASIEKAAQTHCSSDFTAYWAIRI